MGTEKSRGHVTEVKPGEGIKKRKKKSNWKDWGDK